MPEPQPIEPHRPKCPISWRARLLLLLLGVFGALGLPRPGSAQATPFAVQPGDQLEIRVFTRTGEPLQGVIGPRYVDLEGAVYLPFVGSVDVRGLDAAGIRSRLEQRFASFYDNVVVDVIMRYRVNVTGAVRTPGHYFVVPGTTIQDAIALAGGVTSEIDSSISSFGGADPGQTRLVRGETVRIIDMRADELTNPETREPVASGDWIFVPIRERARLRENLQLASSVLTVVGSLVAIIAVLSR